MGTALASIGCGGGEEAQGGGLGSGGNADTSGQGGTGGSVVLTCICPDTTHGCIESGVTRAADATSLPWRLWPAEADGRGTLIVSAYSAAATHYGQAANVDFTGASASYVVEVGCVPAGTYTMSAFLDDDGDDLSSRTSSDYVDSCPMTRQASVTVSAQTTTRQDFVLVNSCD
jgi:hypothetical protein